MMHVQFRSRREDIKCKDTDFALSKVACIKNWTFKLILI